jgi:hypothetical protein
VGVPHWLLAFLSHCPFFDPVFLQPSTGPATPPAQVAFRKTGCHLPHWRMPLSPTERVLREVRTWQGADRLRAGSAWHRTTYVFTTELGEPWILATRYAR